MTNTRFYATRYHDLGWSVVPCKDKSKLPSFPWKKFSSQRPTEADIAKWDWHNIAIITGEVSGNLVVIDADLSSLSPDEERAAHAFIDRLPTTATVMTAKGYHLYFHSDVRPTRVGFIKGIDIRGDGGYVIAPPSIHPSGVKYEWVNDPEDGIAELPEWAATQIAARADKNRDERLWETGLQGASEGSRNATAASLTGKILGQLESTLWEAVAWPALIAWNSHNTPPMPDTELRTTFESIASTEAIRRQTTKSLVVEYGDSIEIIGPPTKWWIRGFVPKGELVMVYGQGGVGKSSWASYLASDVTQRGGKFGFAGVEEPFRRFLMRAVLSGANRSKLCSIKTPSDLMLPSKVARLKLLIEQEKLDVFYLDSIYSHFETDDGLNAAERARRSLAPLAEVAQATGCTIIGVFHENKAGQYLGSVEMSNVARYLLKAARRSGSPMYLSVEKTNLFQPPHDLLYGADETVCCDPLTGEVQLEELEDGTEAPMTMHVLRKPINLERAPEEEEDEGEATTADTYEAVLGLHRENPMVGTREVQQRLGLRRLDVLALCKKAREELGIAES